MLLISKVADKDCEKAKNYITRFFSDKEMYCGGLIPSKILFTPRYISAVLNSSTLDMKKIYSMIELNFEQFDAESGLLADDIKLVISVLRQCSIARIPQENAIGILMIYLECCEGFELTWD